MEHLLKDGGDLDSMDRSLLDYGQNKVLLNQQQQQPNGGHPTSASGTSTTNDSDLRGQPASQYPTNGAAAGQHHHSTSTHAQNDASNTAAAIIFSAATPPVTPVASPEGVKVMPVIKRDLVVRFREQQNSVKCEMAATKRGTEGNHHSHSGEGGMDNNGSSGATTTTNIKYKEQYEVQHYSSHPHGPMSPCDSENSVCNRSRENLIGKPPKKLHMYILPILFYTVSNILKYIRYGIPYNKIGGGGGALLPPIFT